MHVIAAKAVGFKLALGDEFREDQRRTIENARSWPRRWLTEGARVVSGGTDNHLMLVDVTPLGVTGREAEHLLDEIGITVNKNAIPFDTLPPNTASGIRIGTPATTTRGFGPDEMRAIGRIIIEAIRRRDEPAAQARLAGRGARDRGPVPGPGAAPRRDDRSSRAPGRLSRRIVVAFVVAALLALVADAARPPFRRAVRDGRSAGRAAGQRRPMPRAGGLAVAAAFLLVALAVILVDRAAIGRSSSRSSDRGRRSSSPCSSAALAAAAIGVIDDFLQLRARWQLVGQLGSRRRGGAGIDDRLHRQPVRARRITLAGVVRRRRSRSSGSWG